LSWDAGHQVRLGQIWLVSPISAFSDLGGFDGLFGDWGGESISWAGGEHDADSVRCGHLVAALSAVSVPTVVVAHVDPRRLPDWKSLWPHFVAIRLGHADCAGEWYVDDSDVVGVLGLISPGDDEWREEWFEANRHC
jgi:hypothetical protein